MIHKSMLGLALAAALALPAVAQEAQTTATLNANVATANDAAATTNAVNQAQYEADRQAYMDALVAHDAAVDRGDARYVRQRNAYADAMAAWRMQADACKRGHQKACRKPTPNPADYY